MSERLINDSVFRMVGVRGILERAGGAIQIRQQVEAIEQDIYQRPALVFDLAKAMIETVCKTILEDLGVGCNNNYDCPRLLRETLTHLRLFPSGHEAPSEITESIRKTVNGLMTTVQGLCELRSREGMASHGRGAFERNLEPIQAVLAASSADTISSFLWNVYRAYSPVGQPDHLSYGDNPDFNEWIDQSHESPVQILEMYFKQSEILFNPDRRAYLDILTEYRTNPELQADEEVAVSAEEGIEGIGDNGGIE